MFALSACGGSSDSSGGDESAIETAIEESATSENPKICSEFRTAAFNKAEYPEGNALKECEEATEIGYQRRRIGRHLERRSQRRIGDRRSRSHGQRPQRPEVRTRSSQASGR